MKRHAARVFVAPLTVFVGCAAAAAVRYCRHHPTPQRQKKVTTHVTVEYRYGVR